MANETTSPEALAAAEAFNNTVDTLVQQQQMQQALSGFDLKDLKGFASIQHTADAQVAAQAVPDLSQDQGIQR